VRTGSGPGPRALQDYDSGDNQFEICVLYTLKDLIKTQDLLPHPDGLKSQYNPNMVEIVVA